MQSARDWMARSTKSSLCSQTLLNMSASKSKLLICLIIQELAVNKSVLPWFGAVVSLRFSFG